MSDKTKTSARVRVTIEVEASGTWGPECTLDQVYDQAKDSALGRLRQLLSGTLNHDRIGCVFRIVDEPEVIAVLVEEKRR